MSKQGEQQAWDKIRRALVVFLEADEGDVMAMARGIAVVREAIGEAVRVVTGNAAAEEREACARVAERQPCYPDTHTGLRQQWVKEQIAAGIRARGKPL